MLTIPRLRQAVRRLAVSAAEAVLDRFGPTFVPAAPATAAVPAVVAVAAPEPAPVVALFGPDQMPSLDVVEAAAADFDQAADLARQADRGKRRSRKLLDRLPAGRYGGWDVLRVESGRSTADLDRIRATYARLGLGDVPMKPCAPSLKVARAVDTRTLAAVAA